jgi:hypothetical protein
VAHRQDEKERRKAERLAREEAERRSAGRRKRLQLAFGALLAIVAGGRHRLRGHEPWRRRQRRRRQARAVQARLGGRPAEAARAADERSWPRRRRPPGCTLSNPAFEGADHRDKDFKASDYKTNPPTSGNHNPDWYDDGIYAPGDVPRLGHARPPARARPDRAPVQARHAAATVKQLEALHGRAERRLPHAAVREHDRHEVRRARPRAWTHSVTCPEMNDKVFDALRTFRARFIDKGPEPVP